MRVAYCPREMMVGRWRYDHNVRYSRSPFPRVLKLVRRHYSVCIPPFLLQSRGVQLDSDVRLGRSLEMYLLSSFAFAGRVFDFAQAWGGLFSPGQNINLRLRTLNRALRHLIRHYRPVFRHKLSIQNPVRPYMITILCFQSSPDRNRWVFPICACSLLSSIYHSDRDM